MKLYYKTAAVIGIVVAAVLVVPFLPWRAPAARLVEAVLAARGVEDVHLTLGEVDTRSVTFRDITVGKGRRLTADNVVVGYSLQTGEASAAAHDLGFTEGDLKAVVAGISARLQDGAGDWSIQGLQGQAGSVVLPALAGGGTLKLEDGALQLAGQIKSKDNAYHADFTLDDAQLTLISLNVPWKGGTISTKGVDVPLNSAQPIHLVLQVRRVSTDALFQALTGERVSATGSVSGSLPLVVGRDGTFSLGAGVLRADGAGLISVPPDAVPAGGDQVGMVRDILQNFHYNGLSINVNSDEKGVSLLVALAGNNPGMYNGRPVKLNVRLAGDVLDYIRQNVLLLTAPEAFLRQDQK